MTRNPKPDIIPAISAIVSVVNFTVTRNGLEGQLLGVTIRNEKPQLEEEKSKMLKQEEDFKLQLADLENSLLKALSESEGNLLENTSLIESLTKTKSASLEISKALQASAEASLELDKQRKQYQPYAHQGSKIYFLIQDLSNINNMYRFSLSDFTSMFKAELQVPMST